MISFFKDLAYNIQYEIVFSKIWQITFIMIASFIYLQATELVQCMHKHGVEKETKILRNNTSAFPIHCL